MFSLEQISSASATDFSFLAPPDLVDELEGIDTTANVYAIGATVILIQPAGLILVRAVPEEAVARVLLLNVVKDRRRLGIGTALLEAAEALLAGKNIESLELRYQKAPVSDKLPIEFLLEKSVWTEPEEEMLLMTVDHRIFDADWLKSCSLPSAHEIFPWSELRQAEKEWLIESNEKRPWYPRHVSPFKHGEEYEPMTSFGLRSHGKVAGWIMTRRLSEDTMSYESLFIRRELQSSGCAVALLGQAIRGTLDVGGVRQGIFGLDPKNLPARAFFERACGEFVSEIKGQYRSGKLVGKGAFRREPGILREEVM